MVASSQTLQNTGLRGSYVSLSTLLMGLKALGHAIQMASVISHYPRAVRIPCRHLLILS